MKVLVLNSGSSTLKFQVIDTTPEQIASSTDSLLAKGVIERIGSSESLLTLNLPDDSEPIRDSRPMADHTQAIEAALAILGDREIIRDTAEIEAVGHRIVHGGEHFQHSIEMDEDVVRKIESCIPLAPLHNPANLKGYSATRQHLPHARHVAVFDTSFHHTMPAHAFLYGIPYMHYQRDKVRRYGFHGTSHRFVSWRYGQIHGKKREDYKLITCHLGNGCSVCAIDHGRSVDTSMGYTPLEGLLMGTRPGDVDPGVILYLLGQSDNRAHEVEVLLNRYSGLYGVSGISNDMRDVLKESSSGNERARLAVDLFAYRIRHYVGAYLAVLNGADALIFTGGIGENAAEIRAAAAENLDAVGIRLDPGANESARGKESRISAEGSPTEVWVIPTNEELLIARDAVRVLMGLPVP